MAEIERKAIKQSRRNAASRLVHARNDKDTIAGWKLDLGRILQIFNVRPVVFTRSSLTVTFQTELAMNTHVAVSDIRHDLSKIREEIGGIAHPVSVNRARSVDNRRILTRYLQLLRSKLGQQLRLLMVPPSHICIQRARRVTFPATEGLFRS